MTDLRIKLFHLFIRPIPSIQSYTGSFFCFDSSPHEYLLVQVLSSAVPRVEPASLKIRYGEISRNFDVLQRKPTRKHWAQHLKDAASRVL